MSVVMNAGDRNPFFLEAGAWFTASGACEVLVDRGPTKIRQKIGATEQQVGPFLSDAQILIIATAETTYLVHPAEAWVPASLVPGQIGDLSGITVADYTAFRASTSTAKQIEVTGYDGVGAPNDAISATFVEGQGTAPADDNELNLVRSDGEWFQRVSGVMRYTGAPTYLKLQSKILQGLPITLDRAISQAKIDAIRARTAGVDVTTEMASLLSDMDTAKGGRLILMNGLQECTGVSVGRNVVLSGESWGFRDKTRGSCLVHTGTGYLIDFGDYGRVTDLALLGTATSDGAMDISTVSLGGFKRLLIADFTKTGAVAINFLDAYRIKSEQLYLYENYTHLKFRGAVTAFEMSNANFSLNNAAGYVIDAAGGSGTACDLDFVKPYFDASRGQNPILATCTGALRMHKMVAESPCQDTVSIANPRFIQVNNPCELFLNGGTFSGFLTAAQAYTGDLNFLYLGDSAPKAIIKEFQFNQNNSLGVTTPNPSGSTLRFIRSLGVSRIHLQDCKVTGTGFASLLEAKQSLLSGLNPTYSPKNFEASVTFAPAGFYEVYNRRPPADVGPPFGSDIATTVITTTGIATDIVWTRTFAKNSLGRSTKINIHAWGRKTGTAGNKNALLSLTDTGAATSWNASTVTTAADAWETYITIVFRGPSAQSISITSFDGATTLHTSNVATKDGATYDLQLDFSLVVAAGVDTMTLDGIEFEIR